MLLACSLFAQVARAAEKPQQRSPGVNVALGAKYTLSPQPNYSYCTDHEDTVQLTDGKSTAAYFWTQKGTVGWSGAPYAVVTVDLGRIEPICGVAMTTAAGVAGVLWPASINIHTSDDGKSYRDVGDLVALDRKAIGPFPEGYAIRRLATGELKTRGRYVRLLIIPMAGCPFIFTDEVEVFRGPTALLAADPGGKPVGDVAEIFQHGRIRRALEHRFLADAEALKQAIRQTPSLDPSSRAGLLERLAAVRGDLKPEALPHDTSFRAVLPIGEAHARLFGVQAELWRAAGAPKLAVSVASAWDPLELFKPPALSPRGVEIHTMRGEYRAAAVNLLNSTDRPLEVRVECESAVEPSQFRRRRGTDRPLEVPADKFEVIRGSPTPGYVTAHEVVWTDTSQGTPVAAALPEARKADGAWKVAVLPGLVRQVWFTFHVSDQAAGDYPGRIMFCAEGIDPVVVGLRLRVYPMKFPRQTTLLLGGWDYTDADGTYGVTPRNREAFLRHLREHFVNTPWASGGVMLQFQSSGDAPEVRLDTRRFDEWIARWPNAKKYMVFLSVGPTFAGAEAGKPEFDRGVGAWIKAWVRHLAAKGIAADRLGLLIQDEPGEGADVRPIVAWARAIRTAEPKVLIWEDPTYQDPRKAPAELFEVCDILCPNRPMWLAGGKPFEQFYLDQQRRGRTLQFYSCSGPVRSLDPYSYHRLQAWHCWHVGGTGSFFWAFGDNSGSSSWNEYLVSVGPFTPLFLDDTTVTAGKQMEAIRESVEDFETLVMLRDAIKRAKAAGRNDNVVAQAERLLSTGVAEVLAAPGADQISWQSPKDRTKADALRVQVLEALAALR
jgi:hypothetical protein